MYTMLKRRFYEKHSAVSQAVESLLLFPDDIQRIIAKGFSTIAERDCQAAEIMKEFKSLGTDKVLALYKSKTKKRKYDQNPITHQAMNYLMIMSDESQIFMAGKIMELVGFMQDYLKLCKRHAVTPQRESVETISNTYVMRGATEAKIFLKKLDAEIHLQLAESPPVPKAATSSFPPVPAVGEVLDEIAIETSGQKIRKNTGT